jgi:hypothetical protein
LTEDVASEIDKLHPKDAELKQVAGDVMLQGIDVIIEDQRETEAIIPDNISFISRCSVISVKKTRSSPIFYQSTLYSPSSFIITLFYIAEALKIKTCCLTTEKYTYICKSCCRGEYVVL